MENRDVSLSGSCLVQKAGVDLQYQGRFWYSWTFGLQSLKFGVANDRGHFSVQQPSPLRLGADGNSAQPRTAKRLDTRVLDAAGGGLLCAL